jgi:beta-phosphoglucomutase-like phosphatase (HAD superfamily)
MIKAVLWDLDGTLVDSAEFHWRAWRRARMRTVGVSLMHTHPAADVCVGTFPELPADTFDRLLPSA